MNVRLDMDEMDLTAAEGAKGSGTFAQHGPKRSVDRQHMMR